MNIIIMITFFAILVLSCITYSRLHKKYIGVEYSILPIKRVSFNEDMNQYH